MIHDPIHSSEMCPVVTSQEGWGECIGLDACVCDGVCGCYTLDGVQTWGLGLGSEFRVSVAATQTSS